jgi:hypothetical protein
MQQSLVMQDKFEDPNRCISTMSKDGHGVQVQHLWTYGTQRMGASLPAHLQPLKVTVNLQAQVQHRTEKKFKDYHGTLDQNWPP